MQKIIKLRSPSRQLLDTVNFAFMKNFDSLVKIAVFRASLLFLGDLHHALRRELNTRSGQKRMTQISHKKKKIPKNGFFD